MEAAGEHRDVLDVCRQRPDILDAREQQQFADLLEADIDFAAREEVADRDAGRRTLELAFDLIGDAQALEQAFEINAARARRIADAIGGEQRLLDRVGGADVGLGCASTNRDADARLDQVDAAPLHDLALLDHVVERGSGQDHEVVDLASLKLLDDVGGPVPGGHELVAALALELRGELGIGLLDGVRAQDLDFRCCCHSGDTPNAERAKRRRHDRDGPQSHDVLPWLPFMSCSASNSTNRGVAVWSWRERAWMPPLNGIRKLPQTAWSRCCALEPSGQDQEEVAWLAQGYQHHLAVDRLREHAVERRHTPAGVDFLQVAQRLLARQPDEAGDHAAKVEALLEQRA